MVDNVNSGGWHDSDLSDLGIGLHRPIINVRYNCTVCWIVWSWIKYTSIDRANVRRTCLMQKQKICCYKLYLPLIIINIIHNIYIAMYVTLEGTLGPVHWLSTCCHLPSDHFSPCEHQATAQQTPSNSCSSHHTGSDHRHCNHSHAQYANLSKLYNHYHSLVSIK